MATQKTILYLLRFYTPLWNIIFYVLQLMVLTDQACQIDGRIFIYDRIWWVLNSIDLSYFMLWYNICNKNILKQEELSEGFAINFCICAKIRKNKLFCTEFASFILQDIFGKPVCVCLANLETRKWRKKEKIHNWKVKDCFYAQNRI